MNKKDLENILNSLNISNKTTKLNDKLYMYLGREVIKDINTIFDKLKIDRTNKEYMTRLYRTIHRSLFFSVYKQYSNILDNYYMKNDFIKNFRSLDEEKQKIISDYVVEKRNSFINFINNKLENKYEKGEENYEKNDKGALQEKPSINTSQIQLAGSIQSDIQRSTIHRGFSGISGNQGEDGTRGYGSERDIRGRNEHSVLLSPGMDAKKGSGSRYRGENTTTIVPEKLNLDITKEEQDNTIKTEKEANKASFSFTQNSEQISLSIPINQKQIDTVLMYGGNEYNIRLNIIAEFTKGKTNKELANFLKNTFTGGNGFYLGEQKICAWYSDKGIHLANNISSREDYTQIL